MNRIPYGKQNITDEDIQAVIKVLKSEFLTQGPAILSFEKAFANYVGCKYAVAVSNATAALHLSAMALGVSSSDKVITTPLTFVASANCIQYCGGEIIFSDIDPRTYLLDLNKLENLLEKEPIKKFSGIIAVDFAGLPNNMEQLKKLAEKYGLWLIQDACHSPGGYFFDSKSAKQNCGNGAFADLTIFSFHPVKHIAAGEGGMITTNNKELYDKLLNLRSHGIQQDQSKKIFNHGPWYYEMQTLGYNYRLTDIQAALGESQLQRASAGLQRRKEIANKYFNIFSNVEFIKGQSGYHEGHAYHLYVIEVDHRKELLEFLRTHEIYTQVHYIPVHLMPYYRNQGWGIGDLPIAEKYYENCLSLPIYPSLTDQEQDFVIQLIFEFQQKMKEQNH